MSAPNPNIPLELLTEFKKLGIPASKLETFATVEDKQIYSLVTPGAKAIGLWENLRSVVDRTGFWPLVMGQDAGPWERSDLETSAPITASWMATLKKHTGKNYDEALGVSGMILKAGLELDAQAWLKKHRLPDPTAEDDEWADLAEEIGTESPASKPNTIFASVADSLSGKPLPEVTIALWPTKEGWEVPALMRYGGWNACPLPHLHVALMRRWKNKYDAELVAIAGDIVELRVGNPPGSPEAALELAREHYSYCDDIVTQGTMTLERLAEVLINGSVWYFWWD